VRVCLYGTTGRGTRTGHVCMLCECVCLSDVCVLRVYGGGGREQGTRAGTRKRRKHRCHVLFTASHAGAHRCATSGRPRSRAAARHAPSAHGHAWHLCVCVCVFNGRVCVLCKGVNVCARVHVCVCASAGISRRTVSVTAYPFAHATLRHPGEVLSSM